MKAAKANTGAPAEHSPFTFNDIAEIYGELRAVAARLMQGERVGHSLQTTALMNEAFIRLMGSDWEQQAWNNPDHFIATFCDVMKHVLVDYARRRKTLKRGGGARRVAFNDALAMCAERPQQLLEISGVLGRMASDPWLKQASRRAKQADLRIFGGLSEDEIAAVQKISVNTVRRDWIHAKAWLSAEMAGNGEP